MERRRPAEALQRKHPARSGEGRAGCRTLAEGTSGVESHHSATGRQTSTSREGAMKKTLALLSLIAAGSANAQQGTIIYRLGRDTVAVEQFNRTPQRFTGEMVSRGPAAVSRFQYE